MRTRLRPWPIDATRPLVMDEALICLAERSGSELVRAFFAIAGKYAARSIRSAAIDRPQ